MTKRRMPTYRLATLVLIVTAAAIVLAYSSNRWRAQQHEEIQRNSFRQLNQVVDGIDSQLRAWVVESHGSDINSGSSGDSMDTPFAPPYFDVTHTYSNVGGKQPAWNVQIRIHSTMSPYPAPHVVKIEHLADDENRKLGLQIESILSDVEKTKIQTQSIQAN